MCASPFAVRRSAPSYFALTLLLCWYRLALALARALTSQTAAANRVDGGVASTKAKSKPKDSKRERPKASPKLAAFALRLDVLVFSALFGFLSFLLLVLVYLLS